MTSSDNAIWWDKVCFLQSFVPDVGGGGGGRRNRKKVCDIKWGWNCESLFVCLAVSPSVCFFVSLFWSVCLSASVSDYNSERERERERMGGWGRGEAVFCCWYKHKRRNKDSVAVLSLWCLVCYGIIGRCTAKRMFPSNQVYTFMGTNKHAGSRVTSALPIKVVCQSGRSALSWSPVARNPDGVFWNVMSISTSKTLANGLQRWIAGA